MPTTPGLAAEPADRRGTVPEPEVPARATRRIYSARYKARIVAEYDRLDATGRGALLRREGLYTSHISKWRKLRDAGALVALAAAPGRPAADPRPRPALVPSREPSMTHATGRAVGRPPRPGARSGR